MKRLIIIVIGCILLPHIVKAQLKTFINLEAGPSWDFSRVDDPGKFFNNSSIPGTIGGIALWQELARNISIGTGIYYHTFANGINLIDDRPHQVSIPGFDAILIPARISLRGQISDSPFSITARTGYQFGIVLNEPLINTASSLITNDNEITCTYSIQEDLAINNSLHLIEVGLSLDYIFTNNWQLSLALSHFSGLKDIKNTTLDYTTSNGDNYLATYSNDGSRFQSTFCLNVPVSNLWEKKNIRTHRRIEHSKGRGSDIRVKRYIYLGGDIGAVWRLFQSTNPSIGPLPVTGKGIFRYSNLRTGLYFGYKFNENASLDIGAYFQRSSTFFSIMYDHEVDFVTKTRAPFFLEAPIMFRYSYDVYKEKIAIVPAIGGSLLTHLSGLSYNSGSGDFSYSNLAGESSGTLNYTSSRIARFGYTVKVGAGVEYDLPTKIPLIATCNLIYSQGLRKIDQTSITTSLPETPEESSVSYSGTGWNLSIGIKMPILLGKRNRSCGAQQPTR